MTKLELNNKIAERLGRKPPTLSTGGTERKELFLAVNSVLALGLDPKLSKPELARSIAEIGGQRWDPSCESRGSTITKSGLTKVLAAVTFLTDKN